MAMGTQHVEIPGADCSRLVPNSNPQVQFFGTENNRKNSLLGSCLAPPHPGLDSGPASERARFQRLQGSVALGITKQKGEPLPTPST